MEQEVSKYPSLQTRLTIGFTILGTLITAITIAVLFSNFRQGLREELRQRLASITSVGALQQDGDLLLKVQAAHDTYFEKINEQNLKIKRADPDVIFVYTMMKDEKGIYFIVDAGVPGESGLAEFGAYYEEPGPTLVENFDTIQGTIVEPDFYTDEYGTFLSAYAPIYTASGEKIGVFAVDINASTVVAKEQSFRNLSIFIFLIAEVIIIVGGLLLGRILASPIALLADVARDITEGDLSARAPESIKIREIAQLSQDFNSMTNSLGEMIVSLEDRVIARTSELEETSRQMARRASQLQTVAQVAQSVAALKDFDQLLPEIAKIISNQFYFYHTGIFLLDDNNEYAVLRAASSEGGRKMLGRGHRLKIGYEGIVGYAISDREARIALDVGDDSVYFDNPDLPETRSEMALPLLIGDQVIGALDVQSEQANAFTDEDIDVLSTLANQIAVAIQNALLFEQTQKNVKELERTFQQYVRNEWTQYSANTTVKGFRAHESGLEPIADTLQVDDKSNGKNTIYKVPIKLRGVTIATLDVDLGKKADSYTKEELAIVQAASERIGLALENARLLDESQRRAAKEQLIGDISTKIGASINMRNVLQAAVEELGRVMPGSDIVVQFQEVEQQPDKSKKKS